MGRLVEEITTSSNGDTSTITFKVRDQAALHVILDLVRDLNIHIISIMRIESNNIN